MGMIGDDDDRKPFFKVWASDRRKNAVEDKDIWDRVEMIRLSRSKEWIIVEGNETTGLLKANSEQGKELWKKFRRFDGQGKALMMVQSRNKWGFDLEVDAGEIGFWEQDVDVVLYSKTYKPYKASMDELDWDKMKVRASKSSADQVTHVDN